MAEVILYPVKYPDLLSTGEIRTFFSVSRSVSRCLDKFLKDSKVRHDTSWEGGGGRGGDGNGVFVAPSKPDGIKIDSSRLRIIRQNEWLPRYSHVAI